MGDVVFVLEHGNVTLGQVTAFNLTLINGVNIVTTFGYDVCGLSTSCDCLVFMDVSGVYTAFEC
jgi:hypothetical protein